ncbi:MAG TPA: helix-turn-helix domain-containing protein [Candidatus Obscuribacterales bacterium]
MEAETINNTPAEEVGTGLLCPIIYVLDILSAKWTIEILREMFIRPTRTRRFLSLIPGLSMKTLRERLKAMEEQGLIKRTVYPDTPLRVEYSLTAKGRELYEVLLSLKVLGSRWLGSTCVCPVEQERCETAVVVSCPHRPPERDRR